MLTKKGSSGNVLSDVNLTVTVKKLYDVSSNLISVYRPNYSGSFTGLAHGTDMTEGGWVSLFTSDTDDVTTSLKVRRKDNNNLVPTSRNGNTLRFQMPASDVRIEGTEKDINHLDHIDMLCKDRMINIPANVKSLKIYDNGGSSENYTDGCEASLLLIPPAGYQIKLTGTVATEKEGSFGPKDYLEIDDGEYLVKKVYSTSTNSPVSVGTVTTEHRSMYLYFYSDGLVNAAGLDLMAELVGDPHTVTVNTASYGSVTPSSLSAGTGDTVTLTATPNVHYALQSVVVKTSPGNETIEATANWKTNKITFVMPNSNVKVTPTFAPDTYDIINTTQTGGSLTVASSAKMNSTVTITANPETGYMLKDIVIKDANNNTIKLVKNNFTSFSFTMPLFSKVTVTPIWTTVLTAEGGLYVNMPKSGGSAFRIPAGVKSFKVYDDGGKDGDYGYDANGSISLRAPVGYVLVLKGRVNTYSSSDYLGVYSSYDSFQDQLGTLSGSSNCAFVSKDSSLTLKFVSDGSGTGWGLDLTVNVVKYELVQGDDDGTHYVNMFFQRKMEYNIPETLKSFKVYDEGGKDGDYSGNNRDTLVLKAPEGYVLQLSGSVTTEDRDDTLFVYSGTVGTADTVCLGTYRSSTDGSAVSIGGKVLSRGNSMTLVFKSDSYLNYVGLDLTVKLVKLELEQGDDGENHYVNMFYQRKMEYNIPETFQSFKVYDEGGKDGNYSGNNRDTLVLNAPTGYVLQLSGRVTTYDRYDTLFVYSGTVGTADTVCLGKYRSSTDGSAVSIGGKVLSRGNSMTLVFKSNNYYGNYAGLDLTVTLVPVDYTVTVGNVAGGRLADGVPATANVGDEITLTANSASNYFFDGISVVDENNNEVALNKDIHWYSEGSNKTVSFIMPSSNVIITPKFVALEDLYIDLARNKSISAKIPDEVMSFKVYDNGGKDKNYADNSLDTLVIKAPSRYILNLSGKMNLFRLSDSIYVYDGADTESDILFKGGTKESSVWATIEKVVSTGPNMTILFKSDHNSNRAGLDLTVTLIPTYTVAVETVVGGSVSSDKASASKDETVTLTASAKEGYLFDGVSVEDADGNAIALNKDIHWYSGITDNTITFLMPANAVTVTPKFSPINDLYVNMPKSGGFDVNIPQNVTSFKIYDDGGENGDYSNGGIGQVSVIYDKNSGNAGLKLSGSVSVKNGTTLNIYAMNDDIDIFYTNNGSSDGHAEDIGTFINSSSLLFEFSKGASSAAGLDLRVDVVKSPGAGVEVVYDDAHVIGNGNFKRWATITDGNTTSTLNVTEDVDVDTVMLTRKFKKDVYSTIVFPFDVKADDLGGVAKVLRFNGFKQLEDKSWAVRMKRVWTTDSVGKNIDIAANTPYLVVMDDEKMVVRTGVTLRKTVEPIAMAEGCSWTFNGALAYMDMPEGNPNVYGFQDNKFVRAGEKSYVNALRAYLLKPTPQLSKGRLNVDGNVYAGAATASLNDNPDELYIVEDDDEKGEHTTVVGRYNVRTGEFKMLHNYDLKGRNVGDKANKARGAYYGKKVIK